MKQLVQRNNHLILVEKGNTCCIKFQLFRENWESNKRIVSAQTKMKKNEIAFHNNKIGLENNKLAIFYIF